MNCSSWSVDTLAYIAAFAEAGVNGSVGLLLLKDRNINIYKDGGFQLNYFIDFSEWKECSSQEYITDQYLKDNNYATVDYVDTKIQALQQSIDDDVKQYISTVVDEQMGTVLDEKVENSMNNFLLDHMAKDEDVTGVF